MFITGAVALACPSVLSIQGNSHFVVRRCCFFGEKILHLQSRLKQGRSSAGLERFSHIEEVIGSNPIVPTCFYGALPRTPRLPALVLLLCQGRFCFLAFAAKVPASGGPLVRT